MEFMIYVLFFLTALLAISGMAALLRSRRANPDRVRERLRALAPRVSKPETAADGSILRSHGGLRLASLGRLEMLLYRAGGSLTLSRFLNLGEIGTGPTRNRCPIR